MVFYSFTGQRQSPLKAGLKYITGDIREVFSAGQGKFFKPQIQSDDILSLWVGGIQLSDRLIDL